jgi:hypothetical protein
MMTDCTTWPADPVALVLLGLLFVVLVFLLAAGELDVRVVKRSKTLFGRWRCAECRAIVEEDELCPSGFCPECCDCH